jgi:hypothetical protein
LTVMSLNVHFWKSLMSCGCATVCVLMKITLLVFVSVRRRVRLVIRRLS